MRSPRGAVLALWLLGCGSTHVAAVPFGTRPRRPHGGGVALYTEDGPLPARFREVGLVQVEARGTHAEDDHVREALRQEAARLGADAVVRVRIDRGRFVTWGVGVAVREGVGPPAPLPESDGGVEDAGVPAPWGSVPAP